MRIISRKAFRTFWESHPESEDVFVDFYQKLKQLRARNVAKLRQIFPSADLFGDCIVFNVGGNNYRVIVHLDFSIQTIWIRSVMSHAEYDKEKWKTDC